MKLLKTIGYLGAGLALFACGEAQDFDGQIDELALGQAEYAVQRACLSEDPQLFKSCTSKDASDKACKTRLKKVRIRCALETRPVRAEREEQEARPVRAEREAEESRPERPESQEEARPEAPESCESRCRAHAHETFLDCVETGRDERRCRDYAADLMEECIVDRCQDSEEEPVPPRPEPASCEDTCRSFGHAAFDRCVESGRRPVMCRSYASRLIQSCIESRCTDDVEPEPRPEPSNCAARARAAHTQCLETGRDETVCLEHAHRVHAACVEAEAQDTEADTDAETVDSDAPSACERRSRALFSQCIDNGGSRLRCQALSHRFLDRCNAVESDEDIDDAAEADDADAEVNRACAQRARATHAQCQRDTRGSDRCDTVARGTYQRCVELNDDANAHRPEPNNGADRSCGERARQLYADCIEDDRDAERCGVMAHQAADRCESANQRD